MTDGLHIPLGEPGSGRRRYGAAMALYRAGQISDAALEVYRVCSALDRQDPAPILAALHLPAVVAEKATRAQGVAGLLAEIDLILARAAGPGLAELRRGIVRATPNGEEASCAAPELAQALEPLGETHPALAAAIASADLAWVADDTATNRTACLIGKTGAYQSPNTTLTLHLIVPGGTELIQSGPALCLPLTGPHNGRLKSAKTFTQKPAHRPIWIDQDRPLILRPGPIFLGLTATLNAK